MILLGPKVRKGTEALRDVKVDTCVLERSGWATKRLCRVVTKGVFLYYFISRPYAIRRRSSSVTICVTSVGVFVLVWGVLIQPDFNVFCLIWRRKEDSKEGGRTLGTINRNFTLILHPLFLWIDVCRSFIHYSKGYGGGELRDRCFSPSDPSKLNTPQTFEGSFWGEKFNKNSVVNEVPWVNSFVQNVSRDSEGCRYWGVYTRFGWIVAAPTRLMSRKLRLPVFAPKGLAV